MMSKMRQGNWKEKVSTKKLEMEGFGERSDIRDEQEKLSYIVVIL